MQNKKEEPSLSLKDITSILLYLLRLKYKKKNELKRKAKLKPKTVPNKGNIFKYHGMYSKSKITWLEEINIEGPKKDEPTPTKLSLNHKPEKILPITNKDKANKILLPITRIP